MTEILMFHRVLPKKEINSEDAYNIRGTLISQERLENIIIQYLKQGYTFRTICNLENKATLKQVALTFDDGYLDNYLYAKPILSKYNIKATFYPIIGYCKEQKVAPLDYYYHYINRNIKSEDKENWIIGQQKKVFLSLSIEGQKKLIDKLFLSESKPITEVSYMTIKQLQELQKSGHEIGGHSYYHDIYTKLDKQLIVHDIKKTKQALNEIGIEIKSYAYTDGQYNYDVLEVMRNENIDYGCAIKSNKLSNNINYELERKLVTEEQLLKINILGN